MDCYCNTTSRRSQFGPFLTKPFSLQSLQCQELISEYGPDIIHLVMDEVPPYKICQDIGNSTDPFYFLHLSILYFSILFLSIYFFSILYLSILSILHFLFSNQPKILPSITPCASWTGLCNATTLFEEDDQCVRFLADQSNNSDCFFCTLFEIGYSPDTICVRQNKVNETVFNFWNHVWLTKFFFLHNFIGRRRNAKKLHKYGRKKRSVTWFAEI